jgi:hypothetical protein
MFYKIFRSDGVEDNFHLSGLLKKVLFFSQIDVIADHNVTVMIQYSIASYAGGYVES